MFNTGPLNDLASRIGQALENSPAKDIEKNVKTLLASGLARLDVVPRSEFDVQAQVLLRTREKLEAMELRLAAMEARIGGNDTSAQRPMDPPMASGTAATGSAAGGTGTMGGTGTTDGGG